MDSPGLGRVYVSTLMDSLIRRACWPTAIVVRHDGTEQTLRRDTELQFTTPDGTLTRRGKLVTLIAGVCAQTNSTDASVTVLLATARLRLHASMMFICLSVCPSVYVCLSVAKMQKRDFLKK